MTRWLTGFVGALIEAWQELRIHRTRVLLSLIGVAVAVCAITTVVGAGAIVERATIESNERASGRPATLYVSAYGESGAPDPTRMQTAWSEALTRYDITYASRMIYGQQSVQFTDGVVAVQTQAVDQPYGEMHRVKVTDGTWFAAGDEQRLAPAIIVNEIFWQRIGAPDLATHPVVKLAGERETTAVVIGVYPSSVWETEPAMYMLADSYIGLAEAAAEAAGTSAADTINQNPPSYEMWVPVDLSEQLASVVKRDIAAALGEGAQVSVDRQDYGIWTDDPLLTIKLMISGVAVLVLLLGALGLVNIALVTVRQRIREIGVRRSFGATAARVFFAVMMESVVATVVAGVVGVVAAILIVKNPFVEDLIGQGLVSEFPPFPAEAALLGLATATFVGALAGLIPALVAVRVKVIDAIRY